MESDVKHLTALNSLIVTRSWSLSCFCRLFQEDGAKNIKAFLLISVQALATVISTMS